MLRFAMVVVSAAVHAGLILLLVGLPAGGDESLDAGSGDQVFNIEQGVATEGLVNVGEAQDSVEAIEAMPTEASQARAEIDGVETEAKPEEIKPIEQPVVNPQLPPETQVVQSFEGPEQEKLEAEKPKPIEPVQPRQTAALDQQEQVAVDEQRAAGQAQQGGDPTRRSAYFGQLRRHLERKKVNPRSRLSGTVVVRFSVGPAGDVVSREVATSSGHKVLDDAAIAAIERAAPYPRFDVAVSSQPLTVTVPFRFRTR